MTPEEILTENLLSENNRIPALFERRIGQVVEAVDLMLPESNTTSEDLPGVLADIGQRYLRLVTASAPDFSEVATIHRQRAATTFRMLSECDAASFAQRISEKILEQGMRLFRPKTFAPQETFFVAYVESTLSNAAFSAFRRTYGNASPLYLDSVREAVTAVSEGRAVLAMIPVFGAAGEPLASSLSHIEEHELFISAFSAPGGDENIKFAFVATEPLDTAFAATLMTCRVIPSPKFPAGAVLRAASVLGMHPLRFDSDRHSAQGNRSFVLTMSLDGTPPDAFIAYAHLFTASCTLYGVYGVV